MVTLNTMPKLTAAELLKFLAEHESFTTSTAALGESVATQEITALLMELATELSREAHAEGKGRRPDVAKDPHLSKSAKKLLSYLSPLEEERLLTACGLIEQE